MQELEYQRHGAPARSTSAKRKVIFAVAFALVAVGVVTAVVLTRPHHHSSDEDVATDASACVGCNCFQGLGWTPRSNSDLLGKHTWHPKPGTSGPTTHGPKPNTPQCPSKAALVDPATLPSSFDAREQWPGWMQPVLNEGECGSAWSNAIPVAVSDRMAIAQGKNVDLISRGYMLWDPTYPGCPTQCANGSAITTRYHGKGYEWIAGEGAMMQSIMTEGPLTTVLTLHMPAYTNGKLKVDDFHVAVIIGWGEENGVKYWTVQNDFGTNWGEQGYIRVLRGVDEASIEWGRYGYCAVAAKF